VSRLFVARARRTSRLLVVTVTSLAALAASSLAFADGVDVSHWQGSISWTKVKSAGMQFAFMKATESTTYTDVRFTTNWAGAKSAGIYRGAYHFARPAAGTAIPQAKYFVSKVGSFKGAGTLPPVLDLEASGGMSVSGLRTWTTNWLETVEDLTGRRPIIYVSPAFWEHYLGNSTAFTKYPLWIAHYGVSSPRVPGGWKSWTFWQRTSSGSVSGISGNVDMNKFSGTSAQLAALALTSGGSDAPVPPGPTVPAATATALTMTPSTTAAPAINAPVTFTGTLTTAAPTSSLVAAAPVPNAGVGLYAKPAASSTWSKIATATTDTAGNYQLTTRVTAATDYQAVFAGNATYAVARSAIGRVTAPAKAKQRLDLHKDKTAYRLRKGTKVMLYGHATTSAGPVVKKYVRFYRKAPHAKRWTYMRRTATLSPTGWYSTNIYPRRAATYKVVSYTSIFLLPATSNYVTVRVR
jgi:GH25 family lysozyme M1 (1,4-beta-N-acetylmuramidase)